jgi:hypothetical protein
MLTAAQRKARAELASKSAGALRNPTDPDAALAVTEARRNYRAVSAEAYIKRLVNEAPPLPLDVRDRLAVLLRGDDRPPVTPCRGSTAAPERQVRALDERLASDKHDDNARSRPRGVA